MDEGKQTVRLVVHSGLTLIFEFWATEFVLEPHKSVIVELDDPNPRYPPELQHLPGGICFWSSGDHPTVWTPQGKTIDVF